LHPRVRRNPAPAVIILDPAAIMERRETPRRVIHPRPAPGCYIRPTPMPIRHPAAFDLRIPDRPILRRLRPRAVLVQILIARHRRHHRRHRHSGAGGWTFLRQHLGQECILVHGTNRTLKVRRPVDRRHLPGADLHRDICAGDLCCALHNGNRRRVVRVACDDLIAPHCRDLHRATRRLDCVGVAIRNRAQTQIQLALRGAPDQCVVIQSRDVELRRPVHRQAVTRHFHQRIRRWLSPQRIAGRDGIVKRRRRPTRLVGRVERHRAAEMRQASHPPRRTD
jgi:hypothetical protein